MVFVKFKGRIKKGRIIGQGKKGTIGEHYSLVKVGTKTFWAAPIDFRKRLKRRSR